MKKFTTTLALFFSAIPFALSDAAIVEYTEGHGDVGLAYHDEGDGPELELHYHFGDGAIVDGTAITGMAGVEFEPDEAYVRVADSAKITPTSGTLADLTFSNVFTRANGAPVWVLPQGNEDATNFGLPFLGIAADELSFAETGESFSNITMALSSFSGPGQFALWQGVNSATWSGDIDGASGVLSLTAGNHDHYNWGFTEEGIYDLEVTAMADRALAGGGSEPLTSVGTLRFAVGSATAIPEPSSFAAMLVAGSSVVLSRRRRKSNG